MDFPAEGYVSDYLWMWVAAASLVIHTYCFRRFVSPRKHPILVLLGGNVLVFACLCSFVLILGESYFRFFYDQTDSYGLMLTYQRWYQRHFHRNEDLFRDIEHQEAKPPGVRRIAFAGDSFAVGQGIERIEDRFPDRVRKKFERAAPGRVEVFNIGALGIHTAAEARIINYAIDKYNLDEVVLAYCLNDIDDLVEDKPQIYDDEPQSLLNTHSSYFLNFLWFRLKVALTPQLGSYFDWSNRAYHNPAIWEQQTILFDELLAACRKQNVELKIVVFPFIAPLGPGYPFREAHAKVTDYFRARGIPTIDLLDAYLEYDPSTLSVNRFDDHPNEFAHAVAAEVIWAQFYADTYSSPSVPDG